MVVGEASIHNIMGGMESTGGVRLHNHKRKLKQRFDIIKKLGQGTYGKVQLGINKETGQEVAIKTIKKCKIETEADLIRIRREIQIMSSVQHPNIIHIYEVFENREKMVLVMEYAAGGELYDYLSERKVLSEQEARRIFRQIATAVFYCHKHKICHRDLKLENILLDQIGNAKIADFGLSNVFDEQRLLSTFCGSPLYASPEIVKGTPYHGPEVDCWSLGVLLYTLVYGAMPFDGSNFKRLVKQISQSDYFEPKKPSPASPLIRDMLTACPGRRADIEKICSHWWVNEGYEQNCLDIAEDLAAQTPVRLDLLLSLVPQSASAEKLLVGDQQTSGDVANNMSSETLVPTRCHSVGSLMEFDQNNSDRRIRELFEEENRGGAAAAAATDAKRKLETTPSMDETIAATVKKKERSRRKERSDEREPRMYRSTSRHHSAPIPNSIMEETMEVEPTAIVTVPTSKTVDLNKVDAAACLELIEESKEKSPSKERSKTPVPMEHEQLSKEMSAKNIDRFYDTSQNENKESTLQETYSKASEESNHQQEIASLEKNKSTHALPNKVASSKELNDTSKINVPNKDNLSNKLEIDNSLRSVSEDMKQIDSMDKEIKKLKERALSLDSELANEVEDVVTKPVERRRSKIFETAEKFNQMTSSLENEKPKKIFIPGVNVGGAKRAFERKASLTSGTSLTPVKHNASKVIIDVDKKSEKIEDKSKLVQASVDTEEKSNKRDEAKKRAIDIISGAIGKPPVLRKVNGSPPTSPQNQESKKIGLKIPVGPNDIRAATVSVSTPTETKFSFDNNSISSDITTPTTCEISNSDNAQAEEPKLSSKMEITLKSATLPRPRKTSKAEITLSGNKIPDTVAFKSEVEAKIDAFPSQKLRTQRSEIAFPVAAVVPQTNRSSSLEPEIKPKVQPRERIIPIQVEPDHQHVQQSPTTPPKPPMPQRSMSQRSGSLSRQSTADSDTDSALGSTIGPEPIRKSPREYIIPIAVEGGGYVTPRSGSVEPESKTGTPTSTNAPRSRFTRPRRMSSLLSDASEDESPFSTLHRDSEDLLQRHMHRLRSSRPSRQPSEHGDSLSSGEDDDDDGFELLTAENLFSTLLSRVRSLTQRLNVDDRGSSGFPSSRLLGRLGVNSPQNFWSHNKPLSRRLSESQFKHSLSRDTDIFGRKDSTSSINPGSPNSPGSHNAPSSRESVFEIGSNTLPRDKVEHEDIEAETVQIRKEAQESLEQNFTPSLARRLSRQFIEQTRQSLPRSSSISCEKYYQSPTRENLSLIDTAEGIKRHSSSTTSDQTEYRSRSADRNIRRTNSLLEAGNKGDKLDYRFSRRSISLFDDDDNLLPLPRQVMTLGRKYKEIGRSNSGNTWRDTFSVHRTDKIQEESLEDTSQLPKDVLNNTDNNLDAGSVSECTSVSICNSNTNLVDTTSSISIKSRDTSPADSSSNIIDSGKSSYRMDSSKNFENRLLAAENLIKESKLKNLGPSKFDPNLNSNYKETDKCDKESLSSISDAPNMTISKRRSCIPSLRLRSGSLTRDPCIDSDRRKSFAGSQGTLSNIRALSPEKSILSKFFRGGSSKESDSKDKSQKPKQHRISRFLRPDFFDTPREESRYVKEKEAQKAAENERRKSRFMKKKSENKSAECKQETKQEKELKNEMNSFKKDKSDISSDDKSNKDDNTKLKFERQSSRNSFLHSLEKKLEKFRVTDETPKSSSNGGLLIDQKVRALRENSAPPSDSLFTESNLIKRAISVEDMSSKENSLNSRKSRVSSVLGLFKSSDVKQNSNAIKSQSTIMSKLKKSPPKLVKTDVSSTNEDTSSTSKIPMKMVKNDSRLIKKPTEGKKPLDNSITESKKSQYKDKVKEKDISSKERKMSNEKLLKTSGENESQIDKSSPTEISIDKEIVKKANSGKKEDDPKLISNPPETGKVMDNGAAEGNICKREKKVIKTKKNIGSVKKIGTGITKAEKEENGDKKTSKISKLKEPVQKEEAEGTKKKKIVRVVKKVVKKSSENSDNKSEEKGKVLKSIVKGNTSPKKEKSPEAPAINADYSNERNSDLQNSTKLTTSDSSNQETRTKLKGDLSSVDAISNKSELMASGNNSSKSPDCTQINATDSDVTQTKHTDTRGNRGSLKLDLSKIPQHTFRNTTPKKESPKCELIKSNVNVLSQSPKINETNADISSEKFLDSLSKMTHHATITGNKIIIDKPLRAKDVAELKKEVNECARLIENQIELHNDIVPSNEDIAMRKEDEINAKFHTPLNNIDETEPVDEKDIFKDTTQSTNMNTYADEVTSPADEPDSFDSWSICSADMNHTRADLSSPTSPSYSLFSRGDQGESVIDRIRRRSFYLRFNDRRRPSLTVPPPGITLPSSTLPRKYSSSNSRDRDRSKLNSYPSSNKKLMQRSYSLHNEDIPSYRKSPIDKEKYTDLVSYNTEIKTPTEHYSTFSHSTYDPLRKYLRSPTLELSTAHKRYHSTDFSMDDELGAYRNSSLNSILNNNPVEFYGSRNSSMLPRKYGSTITSTEPKTVEYYEELLSPSNPEYLTVRKSPLSNEYLNRSENGYYNINSVKSKSCIAKTKTESTEEINKELEERGRITSQCTSESKNMPSTSSDLQSIIHNTE